LVAIHQSFLGVVTAVVTLWDVVAPWLSRWLSTGGSWVRLPH